jgi:hypothetical protein
MQDTSSQPTSAGNYRLPENNTMQHVTKLSIVEDKPIMMDYWTSSIEKESLIGVKETQEKLLVKSEEEYTSPITKIFKSGSEFIIVTENSIYIVDKDIPTKRISA